MKPIRLEMTAFGPYKDTTPPIDFAAFGNGIYLITGETGAGKTTIFDAVMFALFEEVSAKPASTQDKNIESGSTRDKSMVHSDYAGKETDTVVRMEFEENKRRYTVKRTVHFPRQRADGTYGEPRFTAELTGDQISAVNGSKSVTGAICNILKMDAAQFRQIVMLAQGEFKAFIEARDDKRKEILSTLFDSAPYRLYQERFLAASKRLNEMRSDCLQDIRRSLEPDHFVPPKDTPPEVAALFIPEHPNLKDNLAALVKNDDEERKRLEDQIQAVEHHVLNMERRRAKAERDNGLFLELNQKTRHFGALTTQQDIYKKLQTDKDETALALRQVKPFMDKADEAEKKLNDHKAEYENIKKLLGQARQRQQSADHAAQNNDALREEADTLERRIQKINDHIGDIQKRKKVKSLALDAEQKGKALDEDIRKNREAFEGTAHRLDEICIHLEALQDIDGQAEKCRNDWERSQDRMRRLTEGEHSLEAQTRSLRAREIANEIRRQKVLTLESHKTQAEKHYSDVHLRYLSGYAGKLAVELNAELLQKGEACCPVCGSRFYRADHPEFAHIQDDVPDDAALERAKEECGKAAQRHQEAQEKFNGEKKLLEAQQADIVFLADELLPEGSPWSWRALERESLLNEAIGNVRRLLTEHKSRFEKAQMQVQNRNNLMTEQTRLSPLKDDYGARIAHAALARTEIQGNFNHFSSEILRLNQSLEAAGLSGLDTPEEAINTVKLLQKQKKDLENRIESVLRAQQECQNRVSRLSGQMKSEENALHTSKEDWVRSNEILTKKLSEAGFADRTSCEHALKRVGLMEGEKWIVAEEKRIQDYQYDYRHTKERIEELKEQTKGLKPENLDALQTEIVTLSEQKRLWSEERDALRQRISGHENAMKTVIRCTEQLNKITSSQKRIGHLSDIANGSSGSGGKHAFDGYVLSSTFEEVLDHASYYLTQMTGGKFELLHDREGINARRNAQADFRIMIADMLTGEKREVGSLSGGESFQVSMALALGLSETVQSHAGAVKIDTMFIDEGFGSLDSDSLQQMLSVLSSLSGGQRQIGIISHVDALKENIGKYICVSGSRDRQGSHLRQEY